MPTNYTINFSDTNKTSFAIYPYTSNGPISSSDTTLIPNAVSARTTLKLYGKGNPEYGEGIAQDLVYLLENFTNVTAPVFSVEGQIWNTGTELFIRNADPDGSTGGVGWDAIMVSNGTSKMYDQFNMNNNKIVALADASSLQDALNLRTGDVRYVKADGTNSMSGILDMNNNKITNTTDATNPLDVVNLQTADSRYIKLSGGTLDPAANITLDGGAVILTNGAKVTGLPATPAAATDAVSVEYVDNHFNNSANPHITKISNLTDVDLIGPPVLVDGNLLSWNASRNLWEPKDPGSVGVVVAWGDIGGLISNQSDLQNALNDKASQLDFNTHTADNNIHFAISTIDHSLIQNVGNNTHVQIDTHVTDSPSIHFTESSIAHANIQDVGTIAHNDIDTHIIDTTIHYEKLPITRTFEILNTDLISSVTYEVQPHTIDDNTLSITINGMKQYNHTSGYQRIVYDVNATRISPVSPPITYTGLDQTVIYDFAVSIDGATPVIHTINIGQDTTIHAQLTSIINNLMTNGSPIATPADYRTVLTNIQQITARTSGGTSTVAISDPGTVNTYLFANDPTPTTILSATFRSDVLVPDDIIIAGDVSALFPTGKTFTIRNTAEPTYGEFDGVYSVHNAGVVVSASPITTTIPIAAVNDSSLITFLLPSYTGTGIVPAPSAYGNVHLTPIGGFDQILSGINGLEGDYRETNVTGDLLAPGTTTDYVAFNVDIPSGSKIETILAG